MGIELIGVLAVGCTSWLLLLLTRFYIDYLKKCKGFPFSHVLQYVVYYYFISITNRDVSLNNVLFQKLTELAENHRKEGLFMTFVTRPTLMVFNKDALKVFSNSKFTVNRVPEYKIGSQVMRDGIATSNGERWRSHRKLLKPAFQQNVLKEKLPLFNEHAMTLIKDLQKLADKPNVDVSYAIKYNYLNAVFESVFGLKQDEENQELTRNAVAFTEKLSAEVAVRVFCPWLRPKTILQLTSFGRKHLRDTKKLNDITTDFISEMKSLVTSSKRVDAGYFGDHMCKSITYLLVNRHLNDPTFTFKDIHDEVKTIIGAAYDTVSNTTLWCLFLLGMHPEIQEKVYQEIHKTTSDYISYEETTKLEYLECIILETLRIYPTIPFSARELSEDVNFGKYKVHKGTTIVMLPYLSHRDPETFPDPELFKPERFLNKETKKLPNFLPFAEGNRPCIGKQYALIKLKIFLAHILRNFQFQSLDRREDVGLFYAIVMSPAKPLRMKITKRHKAIF